MKNLILFSFCVLSFSLHSATIKIIGPCSGMPISEGQIQASTLNINVGSRTIDYLTRENIPFKGDQFGISSIDNSKTGDEAIEVLSDTKLRAYGWCFKINDLIPDKMPNEIILLKESDTITWFYAFSTYDLGDWKDYCTPAFLINSSKFCSVK